MSIIILDDISLSYGERKLFDEVSAHFDSDQKVGIVGRNGAGKSTLLKIIAKQQDIDSGSISIHKKKKIAYLPQEVVLESDRSIYDEAYLIFDEFKQLAIEQENIEQQLAENSGDTDTLLERYDEILEKLSLFDAIKAQQKTATVLKGLGFKEEGFTIPVSTLSVGWKMRLVLAKLLLEDADFYLFDEPTNHLDIVTQEWFLQFLKYAPFGYLLVTHDRYFLDNGCDWIFQLSRGKGTMYHGNYSAYIKLYEERQEMLKSAHFQQQKEIQHKKDIINKFRASATKAAMAQSMIKKLDKIELIEIDPPEPVISVSFPQLKQPGGIVLTIRDIAFRYGEKQLFKNVTCEIKRGEKVALIAANGTGKSTLFDLVVGKLEKQEGDISFGHNVHYALFEQDQNKALSLHKTILEELIETCPHSNEQKIRAFLGAFLFAGDDVHKKIDVLSGGEKNRVAMVKVFMQNANFLLLDEPTNHLDLQSKSVLLQALKLYPGTLFFVSHDHQFIENLANSIVELTPTGVNHFRGTYEEYLFYKKSITDTTIKEKDTMKKNTEQKASFEDEKKITTETIKKLEKEHNELEKKKEKISLEFSDCIYGDEKYMKISNEIKNLDNKILVIKEKLKTYNQKTMV